MKKIGFIIAISTLLVAGVSAQSQTKGQTKKTSEGTITTPSKEQSKGDTKTSKTARSNKKKSNVPTGVRPTRSKAVSKKSQIKSEISSPK